MAPDPNYYKLVGATANILLEEYLVKLVKRGGGGAARSSYAAAEEARNRRRNQARLRQGGFTERRPHDYLTGVYVCVCVWKEEVCWIYFMLV